MEIATKGCLRFEFCAISVGRASYLIEVSSRYSEKGKWGII